MTTVTSSSLFCCSVSKQISLACTLLVWLGGVFSTSKKGITLLLQSRDLDQPDGFEDWFYIAGGIGVLMGLVQGFTLFTRICNQNIDRILRLDRRPKWHECYRWPFYIFLGLVISGGAFVTHKWATNIYVLLIFGGVNLMVGVSLLVSCCPFILRRKEIWSGERLATSEPIYTPV